MLTGGANEQIGPLPLFSITTASTVGQPSGNASLGQKASRPQNATALLLSRPVSMLSHLIYAATIQSMAEHNPVIKARSTDPSLRQSRTNPAGNERSAAVRYLGTDARIAGRPADQENSPPSTNRNRARSLALPGLTSSLQALKPRQPPVHQGEC
jgi:hypothetical protein